MESYPFCGAQLLFTLEYIGEEVVGNSSSDGWSLRQGSRDIILLVRLHVAELLGGKLGVKVGGAGRGLFVKLDVVDVVYSLHGVFFSMNKIDRRFKT